MRVPTADRLVVPQNTDAQFTLFAFRPSQRSSRNRNWCSQNQTGRRWRDASVAIYSTARYYSHWVNSLHVKTTNLKTNPYNNHTHILVAIYKTHSSLVHNYVFPLTHTHKLIVLFKHESLCTFTLQYCSTFFCVFKLDLNLSNTKPQIWTEHSI